MSLERHAFAAALLVAAGLALCPVARAQSGDPAVADALFRKGREAAEKGDWATACPKFAESQRLDPAPGTLLNLAECEEHLGQLASSYEHFKTAVETMAPSDDRIPFAKQRMATVEKKVPHLTLLASADLPPNARVVRDNVELGSASFGLALPVDPGTHAIVVSAPGRADRKIVVAVKAGDTLEITLKAGDPAAATHAVNASPTAAPPSTEGAGGGNQKAIGIVLGAVGLAGVAVGAVAGGLVLADKSTVNKYCDPTTHACSQQAGIDAANDGKTWSVVSPVALAAGGAMVVAGVIVLLTSGGGGKTAARSASTFVAPDAYPGGAGLRVIGSF